MLVVHGPRLSYNQRAQFKGPTELSVMTIPLQQDVLLSSIKQLQVFITSYRVNVGGGGLRKSSTPYCLTIQKLINTQCDQTARKLLLFNYPFLSLCLEQ